MARHYHPRISVGAAEVVLWVSIQNRYRVATLCRIICSAEANDTSANDYDRLHVLLIPQQYGSEGFKMSFASAFTKALPLMVGIR